MMQVLWRESAIHSLIELDRWRETLELSRISLYLKQSIDSYFYNQDYTVYIPEKTVTIRSLPVDLRMVLISIGKGDPYKVFYRITSQNIEIFLVRYTHQEPIK